MTTADEDLAYVNERRHAEMKRFLSSALDSENAPRLSLALRAIRDRLADGQWAGWATVLAAALRASDVQVKTLDTQLRNAITCGVLERRGEYLRATSKRPRSDTRELRLVDWPEPDAK